MRIPALARVAALALAALPAPAFDAPAFDAPAFDYDACIAEARRDPAAALSRAETAARSGVGPAAEHCAAMALAAEGALRAAAARLADLAARAPAPSATRGEMLEQAAGFWLDAGETALAGEALDRAVALAPEAPGPRALRAELALRAGRYAEAEADLDVALAARPSDAALLTRRAAARRLGGDPAGALADAEDAISAGDGPAALVERGLAQAALGRRDAAIESWFAAIAADAPAGPAALRARDALQGLALD